MTNISYFIVSFASIFCLINLAITLLNIFDAERYFSEDTISGKVVVLIPARDEEKRIEPLLCSLNSQTKIENLIVVVIDDDSQDQTAKFVENFFKNSFEGSIHTHLLRARPIPTGWNGKSNALQTGYLAFPDADLYITLDADIELSDNAISSSATSMLKRGDSFLSPYPKQVCSHWTHILVQPLLQWSWLATLPLRFARSSARPSTAVANGQFFVVAGDALRSVGGFQDAAHHVLDDLALARSLKRAGFSGTAIPAPKLSRCRMYSNWSDLAAGYQKSLWSAFGKMTLPILFIFFAVYVLPLYVGPIGLMAYLLAVTSRSFSDRISGYHLLYAIFHPVSILIFLYLILSSLFLKSQGTLMWRGRRI